SSSVRRAAPEVNAMFQTIRGIHHVTAIAIDPQANIDFYTQVVGLRLVKGTVNFDDPGTYHFYYGDKSGQPGTILTFFPFVSAGRGRSGSRMVDTVTFAVSAKSLDGWIVRLAERGVDVDGPFMRFSRPTIGFRDPDGLKLEIAAVDGLEPTDAAQSDRDVAASIGGFGAVTLCVEAPDRTIELLTETFGYRQVAEISPRSPWQNPYVERLIGTPYVASAWTGCWSSAKRTCGKFSLLMLRTTMRSARTWRWAKTRRWVGQFSGPASLSPSRSCLGYTTITFGYDFRKAQGSARAGHGLALVQRAPAGL